MRIHSNLPSGFFSNPSILLDFAASDDLEAFKLAVESDPGLPVNGSGLWYGRRAGSRTMGFEERTPLMIAALYGSVNVFRYILAVDPSSSETISGGNLSSQMPKSPVAKKSEVEPVVDGFSGGGAPLPDINTGVYASDEFRMYSFKIKPCSRAYTHDWTECPFAHPGENARRRDPLRHHYSCVPCPEFKKGSCRKADDCEYAHGVFESWLHPAQYRTRLCKDETGCNRKVCFFAHKKDELRPVYASTGSAIDSMGVADSNPSISPSKSPKWSSVGKVNCSTPPPTLQLPGGSRLRSSSNARDVDLEMELFRLESQISQQKRNLMNFSGDLQPANLETLFGSVNLMNSMNSPNSLSPMSDPQLRQNLNHLRNSYPAPSRKLSPTELDCSPKSVAAAMLNSRAAAAFAKRSQSFIDRGSKPATQIMNPLNNGGFSNASPNFAPNWGSGYGKADWSLQEGDLSKLRRSVSFGQRGVNPTGNGYRGSGAMPEPRSSAWIDQMYIEQEQMVA